MYDNDPATVVPEEMVHIPDTQGGSTVVFNNSKSKIYSI